MPYKFIFTGRNAYDPEFKGRPDVNGIVDKVNGLSLSVTIYYLCHKVKAEY